MTTIISNTPLVFLLLQYLFINITCCKQIFYTCFNGSWGLKNILRTTIKCIIEFFRNQTFRRSPVQLSSLFYIFNNLQSKLLTKADITHSGIDLRSLFTPKCKKDSFNMYKSIKNRCNYTLINFTEYLGQKLIHSVSMVLKNNNNRLTLTYIKTYETK